MSSPRLTSTCLSQVRSSTGRSATDSSCRPAHVNEFLGSASAGFRLGVTLNSLLRVSVQTPLLMTLAGSEPALSAPAPEQLEISLFGPGYGESLAVHLGDGRWMIVDSCIEQESRSPAALGYLDAIGVDCSEAVAVVVATHWHDDHIRGLADVVKRCEKARFACSSAFHRRELLDLISTPASGTARLSAGTSEFARVLSIIRARRLAGVLAGGSVTLLAENTIVDRSQRCEVLALSPSSASVERALVALADLLPEHLQPQRRVLAPEPNAASVALSISGDAHAALLGADLETEDDDDRGWGAVLALSPARGGVASLVKVPHHGSVTAHDQRMWDVLLAPSPDAMLTPWYRGGSQLPSDADSDRICALAPDAVIAGRAERKTPRYDRTVERTLREAAVARRLATGRMGHVRARCVPSEPGEWRVELVAEAQRLCRAA
jgi:beta-lactamase superfamily II metal-dependent hydrolase